MTKLNKPISRETYDTLFEAGKNRPVIVSVEPPNLIGFRLKGTRRTYYLTAEKLYWLALQTELRAKAAEKRKAKKRA